MSPSEFEDEISHLTDEQYDAFIQERIARLSPEQQIIAQAREVKRQERFLLIQKLTESKDEEAHERFLDALRDTGNLNCEHGRSYCKHCIACGEMDHRMFPELFNEDGFRIDEDEEE
jgi:hypothetical protein